MCMIAPIVSKTALSEQKQDSLNTSVSVVAPETHSLPFSNTFFTLLPTKGGVAGDVAQRDARAIITFGTMYSCNCGRHYSDCGRSTCASNHVLRKILMLHNTL